MKKFISFISISVLFLLIPYLTHAQPSWQIPGFPQSGNLKNASRMNNGGKASLYQFVCYDIRNNPDVKIPAFSCLVGGQIIVRVESQSFTPIVLILNQNKQLLNKGYANVQVRVPKAGIYTVVVTSQNRKTTGTYNIEVIHLP